MNNRSASGACPRTPTGALPLDLGDFHPQTLLYVHPHVQFKNTLLVAEKGGDPVVDGVREGDSREFVRKREIANRVKSFGEVERYEGDILVGWEESRVAQSPDPF